MTNAENDLHFTVRYLDQMFRAGVLGDLERAELLVLMAYMKHADRNSGRGYPGVDLMAKKLNMSARTVQRARQKLIERGRLQVVDAGGGRKAQTFHGKFRGNTTECQLVMPEASAEARIAEDRVTPHVTRTPQWNPPRNLPKNRGGESRRKS